MDFSQFDNTCRNFERQAHHGPVRQTDMEDVDKNEVSSRDFPSVILEESYIKKLLAVKF